MILIVYQKSEYVRGECVAEGGLGKSPRRNAEHRVTHWHTITRLWIRSMTQSMVITLLREAKDRWKCLICLFSNVAICLMNETDFIKCQGYLSVSNLEYKHIIDPRARNYNGFKVRHMRCHMASILWNQVKINRVGQHKGFANGVRQNLNSCSAKIILKHLHIRL